jgi:hypothetical protein
MKKKQGAIRKNLLIAKLKLGVKDRSCLGIVRDKEKPLITKNRKTPAPPEWTAL